MTTSILKDIFEAIFTAGSAKIALKLIKITHQILDCIETRRQTNQTMF
jgi:hypothetical protein